MRVKLKFLNRLYLLFIALFFICACNSNNEKNSPADNGNAEKVENSYVSDIEEKNQTITNKTNLVDSDNKKADLKNGRTFEEVAFKLIKNIKKGKPIGFLMSETIEFVYHSDNRCDGSTDGTIKDLPGVNIDKEIKILVTNNGEGWACEKKKETTYEYTFKLSEYIKHWDRFTSSNYDAESNTIYLSGSGESDYIVIGFKKLNNEIFIDKFEYRSEDPG